MLLALELAGDDTPVVAFGSLYLAGTVRGCFQAQYGKWLRKRSFRLGMGRGYYGRYLPKCVSAVFSAAAFEAQKAERIPAGGWDVPMDMVFTENSVYERIN